ncbi:TetR/AcrR family transcriptional regulator [Acidipila sp. EB88]|uniref:TetR/AcrR family transcriptional regulator n=1 Tax=Acidipila sp. EB88 TaxID=2305226 RepID=UPI000F6002ED|nr:TetR/AcrR family transcriptional regulator [Acidipila sp. EB88]RRA49320.1 TetR/AcrR family transcriptional regulator [Acidipila sp. EB88]
MSKGEDTRQRIVEIAAPLFNERGFAGCSMADVMEATGLEKGGIYRHFDSKEALAVEVLKYSVRQASIMRSTELSDIPSAIGKLRHVIGHFVERPSPVRGGCPLLNAAVDSDNGNSALRLLAKRAFADWRRSLAEVVEAGVRSGELKPDVQADEVADFIVASLEGALVLSRLERGRAPLRRVQNMLELVLSSLRLCSL